MSQYNVIPFYKFPYTVHWHFNHPQKGSYHTGIMKGFFEWEYAVKFGELLSDRYPDYVFAAKENEMFLD